FVLAISLTVAAAWPAHANAASEAVHIRGIDVAAFPQVTVTVSISGGAVTPQDVHVTEDGKAVSGAAVDALADVGQDVDVVLAVDTSNSMAGQPLASAIAAALR